MAAHVLKEAVGAGRRELVDEDSSVGVHDSDLGPMAGWSLSSV